jgi:hypothetical protein
MSVDSRCHVYKKTADMNSAREVGENAEPCTKTSMIMVSIKSLLRYNVIGSRPSKDRLEAESSSVVTKNSNSTENSGAKKKKKKFQDGRINKFFSAVASGGFLYKLNTCLEKCRLGFFFRIINLMKGTF